MVAASFTQLWYYYNHLKDYVSNVIKQYAQL